MSMCRAGLYHDLYHVDLGISSVATPGPTRAQALVKVVCAQVNLLNSWA